MLDGPDAPLVLDVLAEHPGHAAEGDAPTQMAVTISEVRPRRLRGSAPGAPSAPVGLVHRHSPGKSPLRDTTPAYHRALDLGSAPVLKSTQTSPKR